MDDTYPAYWNFAVTTAIEHLWRLVFHFDIDEEAGMVRRYDDVKPTWVLEMLESLMAERERLDNPKIERLTAMRLAVEEKVIPIYEAGKTAAESYWQELDGDSREHALDDEFPVFRKLATVYIPENSTPSEKSWFVAGFGVRLAEKWFDFMGEILKGR